MTDSKKRIAVIGGGISGLVAAWQLSRDSQVQVTLFESSDRVGGVLETIYDQGYLIERSADNFATLIPDALEFCRELGYESQLIRPNANDRRAFVMNRGRILPIPLGFSLMQPTRFSSMLTTKTLSWRGKLRVAGEYFVPARKGAEDESLAAFATRRLGREAFENLVEPIVSGIFTADPSTLSMQATLPQFVAMEQKSGGLIRGHLHSRRSPAKQVAGRASGARYDQFMAPEKGMSHWVQHIVNALPAGSVRLNNPVKRLRRIDESGQASGKWEVDSRNAEGEIFDGVLIGLPARHAAELLRESCPVVSSLVGSIPYASSAVVVKIVDKADLKGRIDGFGLIVPHKEGRPTLAISYTSNKYSGRTPEDQLLLRIFLGGALAPEMVDESDARLHEIADKELREILGWSNAKPRWQAVVRWKQAMPQYLLGHTDRVSQIQQQIASAGNLQLCGAAYSGVGIPQCVRSARAAAKAFVK
jgi:protoporphyrinogen/coproporphyrinogen III oxidase